MEFSIKEYKFSIIEFCRSLSFENGQPGGPKVISFRPPPREKTEDGKSSLSRREKEILELIAKGQRNKEVAAKLFIAESTVKSHLHNIFVKLHVTSRIEALNKISN